MPTLLKMYKMFLILESSEVVAGAGAETNSFGSAAFAAMLLCEEKKNISGHPDRNRQLHVS
jgi:hypothetical protein